MFTLNVRYLSVHCKHFIIVCSVIVGQKLAGQAHATKCYKYASSRERVDSPWH